MIIRKKKKIWLKIIEIDWLIDSDDMSICLGLFYASKWGNRVHRTLVFLCTVYIFVVFYFLIFFPRSFIKHE